MTINIYLFTTITIACLLLYLIFIYLKSNRFDKYFTICAEETYNLDNLFQIKINGIIVPKVDFLDIPYLDLFAEINTPTIKGKIKENNFSIEFIRPNDRKKAIQLVKYHYLKTVHSFIDEALRDKKEHIRLSALSKQQKSKIQKIACHTCKHKIKCRIAFDKCHYERTQVDAILRKGIRVDMNTSLALREDRK
jgi:hypothetical protein